MEMQLLNHVALVTGSANASGAKSRSDSRSAAPMLSFTIDRRQTMRAKSSPKSKNSAGDRSRCKPISTTSHKFDALFEKIAAQLGRLDILVNSAASFVQTEFAKTTGKEWNESLDTNLKAPFFCSQAAAPLLKKTNGCIVNFADVGGILGWTGYIPHSISKAGVIMLTRCLAKELAPEVRVNAIAPGTITLPDDAPELEANFIKQAPLKRSGRPADIIDAVAYLATAKFVTGHTLVIDGGRVL